MKYCLIILVFIAITSTAGRALVFPDPCAKAINVVMQDTPGFKGTTLQKLQENPNTWPIQWFNFKQATGFGRGGTWDTIIVPACCPSCADTNCETHKTCKTCSCNGVDPCTWKCKCCWGPTACVTPPKGCH